MIKIPLWSRIIIGIILISILSLSLLLASNNLSKSKHPYDYSWTKAICNETQCQDYEIICKNKKVISQTPLTGAIITIDKDWQDPRSEEFRNKFCD